MSEPLPTPRLLSEAARDALVARVNRGFASGELLPLHLETLPGELPPSSYVAEVANIKRALERWCADGQFRAHAARDPAGALASLELAVELDPASMVYLWDEDVAVTMSADELPLQALRYRAFILEKLTHRNHLRAPHPSMHPWLQSWRARQIQRTQQSLPPLMSASIVHAPFAVELSNGCSVGCWFCGISAPKLGDIFEYNEANAALFRAMLDAFTEVFGEATGRGFCYWATDPMDNPDYERFLADFHAHTGTLPQTTTALALRDIERTRALLARTFEVRGMLNRFSLLSLAQVLRVHEAFTPEELLFTELVTQNRENHQAKSRAGRALTGKARKGGPQAPGDTTSDGTIACVTGFLINLVDRVLRLVSPCRADAEHPLGYITFDEARFEDGESLRAEVWRMVETHMRPGLPDEAEVRLEAHIAVVDEPPKLEGPYVRTRLELGPIGDEIIRALAGSSWRVGELLEHVGAGNLARESSALLALEQLHELGYLDRATREAGRMHANQLVALGGPRS